MGDRQSPGALADRSASQVRRATGGGWAPTATQIHTRDPQLPAGTPGQPTTRGRGAAVELEDDSLGRRLPGPVTGDDGQ